MTGRFISVPEAAQRLGISTSAYYRHVEAGELPGLRIGHRITVSVAALERLAGELATCLTIPEAAAELGISPTSYRRGVRRGELPCRHIGRRPVVSRSDLDAFTSADGSA